MQSKLSDSIIKNRGFLNLWLNQILVQVSYNSLNFALLVWIYKLTNSSITVALLLFVTYLPAVIFGLFSGVLVDIIDRKKIIMIINLLLAFCFMALIVVKFNVFAVLSIVFLVNTLAQFYLPAESSAIPLICKRSQLLTANSLFSITLFGSFLAGFGIAGPLINAFDIDFIFIFGAVLLAFGFILSFTFPKIVNPMDSRSKKMKQALIKLNFAEVVKVGLLEVGNTFSLIKGRVAVMVSLFILAVVQVNIAVLGVLIPSFFESVLKTGAQHASITLFIPLGVGMVLGGIFLSRYGYLFPKRTIVSTAIANAGILLFLVGFIPSFGVFLKSFSFISPLLALALGSFCLGLSLVSVVVPSQTALQEYSPDKDRGKVFAALSVLMSFLTLGPVLVVGLLADRFGPLPIFISMGLIIALLGLLALRPEFYFSEKQLPYKVREFLGLGHWKR